MFSIPASLKTFEKLRMKGAVLPPNTWGSVYFTGNIQEQSVESGGKWWAEQYAAKMFKKKKRFETCKVPTPTEK